MNINQNVSVGIEARGREIRDEFKKIISTLPGFDITDPNAAGPCDVLILEIGSDPEKDFQHIADVQAAGSAREVFLTSANKDPQILIMALRSGAREFFTQPINTQEVASALSRFFLRRHKGDAKGGPVRARKGKIIDVMGTKGGVGTTTIAVNLAGSLAGLQGGPSVVIVDLSRLMGEVPLFLNIKPVFDWMQVAKNFSRLDGTYLKSVLLKHSSGIHVLPSPTKLIDGQAPPAKVIEVLLGHLQQLFDIVVVDGGRSIDDLSKVVLKAADKILLIATPSLPCIVNTRGLIDAFYGLGYPPSRNIEVVANRCNQKGGIALREVEQAIGRKISWHLPNDYRSANGAINSGRPLGVAACGSDLNEKLIALASAMAGNGDEEIKVGTKKRFSLFKRREQPKKSVIEPACEAISGLQAKPEHNELRTTVRDRLITNLDLTGIDSLVREVLKGEIEKAVETVTEAESLNSQEKDRLLTEIEDEILGVLGGVCAGRAEPGEAIDQKKAVKGTDKFLVA